MNLFSSNSEVEISSNVDTGEAEIYFSEDPSVAAEVIEHRPPESPLDIPDAAPNDSQIMRVSDSVPTSRPVLIGKIVEQSFETSERRITEPSEVAEVYLGQETNTQVEAPVCSTGGEISEARQESHVHMIVPNESNPQSDEVRQIQRIIGDHHNITDFHVHVHKTQTKAVINHPTAVAVGGNVTVNPEARPDTPSPPKAQEKLKLFRDKTIEYLEKWTKDMVHTKVVDVLVEELLKEPSLYVLKGSPGEGKTTVALMALKNLQERGRGVYVIKTPDDYFAVRSAKKSVLLLDDIFGSSHFNLSNLSRWETVFDDLLALEEHTQQSQPSSTLTLLLVSRSSVLDSASEHLGRFESLILKEGCAMDLTKDVKYTVDEKVQIWSSYARRYNISIEESIVREVCQMALSHGFPHCCRLFSDMYSKNPNLDMNFFFLHPHEFLQQEIKSMFSDEVTGPVLRDMIRNGGMYSLDPAKASSEEAFQIQNAIDKTEGVYLRQEGQLVTFQHPSIYDTVAFIACKKNPLFVVLECSMAFLNDRVRLQGLSGYGKVEQTTVIIDRKHQPQFIGRLKKEVADGNIADVLSHDSFHDERFVKQFMEHVLSLQTNFQSLSALICTTDMRSGDSFLFLCSKSRSSKVLQYICERTKLSKEEQSSTLFGICKHRSINAMQYFLRKYPESDLTISNKKKASLLIVAAQNPCDNILETLMNNQVNIRHRDSEGNTALYYICQHGVEKDASAIETMIERGADVFERYKTLPYSPLNVACKYGHTSVVKVLLKKGADANETSERLPLHLACEHGFNTVVESLIDAGADMNKFDKYGSSALHTACFRGHHTVVTTLLNKGADVHARKSDGYTPLHSACLRGSNAIVTTLIKHKADINSTDTKGGLPLHAACIGRSEDVIINLLRRGADVNKCDKNGRSPLHVACGGVYPSVVATLLSRGAEAGINTCDIKGRTPLYSACVGGCNAIVETLLDKKADVNICDKNGWSPLHAACFWRSVSVVSTLVRNGSDVNKCDNKGLTPLDIAQNRKCDAAQMALTDRQFDLRSSRNLNWSALNSGRLKGIEKSLERKSGYSSE